MPYAELSQLSYQPRQKMETKAEALGYNVLDQPKDKFYTAYQSQKSGKVVLAFKGTSGLKDLLTDVKASVGIKDKSFKRAADVVQEYKQKYPNLKLVGHSIGSTRAIEAGKQTGVRGTYYAPYILPRDRKGTRRYFETTKSKAHISLSDPVGLSALVHLPEKHLRVYPEHKEVLKAHGIGHYIKHKKASTAF